MQTTVHMIDADNRPVYGVYNKVLNLHDAVYLREMYGILDKFKFIDILELRAVRKMDLRTDEDILFNVKFKIPLRKRD